MFRGVYRKAQGAINKDFFLSQKCPWSIGVIGKLGQMSLEIFYTFVVVAAPPTIAYDDKLKSPQSLRGGQKFVIETTIGGVPTPTTSWTRNGQPLMPNDQLSVDVTPTSSKLTITDASADHSGSYVLQAENTVGSATAEFTVTVKGL